MQVLVNNHAQRACINSFIVQQAQFLYIVCDLFSVVGWGKHKMAPEAKFRPYGAFFYRRRRIYRYVQILPPPGCFLDKFQRLRAAATSNMPIFAAIHRLKDGQQIKKSRRSESLPKF